MAASKTSEQQGTWEVETPEGWKEIPDLGLGPKIQQGILNVIFDAGLRMRSRGFYIDRSFTSPAFGT